MPDNGALHTDGYRWSLVMSALADEVVSRDLS
jgi:hypothetical protein